MVKLTADYVGGLIAGFGLGVLLIHVAHARLIVAPALNPLIFIPAFALIAAGASIARYSQRRPKS